MVSVNGDERPREVGTHRLPRSIAVNHWSRLKASSTTPDGWVMKAKLFGAVATLAVFVAIHPALATPLSLADEGSITYDPNTGLQWLDLTQTTLRSYDDVASQLGIGGAFYGYRYATASEVSALFTDAGITNPVWGSTDSVQIPSVLALFSMMGETYNDPSLIMMQGYTNDFYPWGAINIAELQLDPLTGAYWALPLGDDLYPDVTQSVGSFLVRDVGATPLPATLPLFATGLGAMGFFGWCRKRKASAAVEAA